MSGLDAPPGVAAGREAEVLGSVNILIGSVIILS
jgi:hypothetical protein